MTKSSAAQVYQLLVQLRNRLPDNTPNPIGPQGIWTTQLAIKAQPFCYKYGWCLQDHLNLAA